MKSELHSKLQDKAEQYLLNKSYWVCSTEMPTPVGIIDCWGMSRASNYNTMAIEVKVSRSDFKNKRQGWKLRQVENIANECYLLCPFGLIQPEEVCGDWENWGLLWYRERTDEIFSVRANWLENKKKAKYVEMTDKNKLKILINFLYNRVNIVIPNKLVELKAKIISDEK